MKHPLIGRFDILSWLGHILPPVVMIIVILIVWDLGAKRGDFGSLILPTPGEVLVAAVRTKHQLVPAMRFTLLEAVLGLVVGFILGFFIATFIDFSPVLRRALYPLLIVSQTVQILAIAPLIVIWFGFGITPKIIVVVIVTFFPITLNMIDGYSSTDPLTTDLLRSIGANRLQIWWFGRLPSSLPSLFSGLRIASTYSVVGATIGEWVGGADGLGVYLLRSKNAFATDQVFAAMLVTTALSIMLFSCVLFIEFVTLPWYYAAKKNL